MNPAPVCPICSGNLFTHSSYPTSSSHKVAESMRFSAILNCQQCGLGMAHPLPDQVAVDTFYASGNYWHEGGSNIYLEIHNRNQDRFRVKSILPFIDSQLKKISVLDVGAGSGFVSYWLKELLGREKLIYHFIEPDTNQRKSILERNVDINIETKSIDSLGAETYDVIFLNHVLEHVVDPCKFLSKLQLALKKSGHIYIETPNRDDQIKKDVFPHTLFFNPSTFERLASRLKLKTIECKEFGSSHWINEESSTRFTSKVISKLFQYMTLLGVTGLATMIDTYMFRYHKSGQGPWLKWIASK